MINMFVFLLLSFWIFCHLVCVTGLRFVWVRPSILVGSFFFLWDDRRLLSRLLVFSSGLAFVGPSSVSFSSRPNRLPLNGVSYISLGGTCNFFREVLSFGVAGRFFMSGSLRHGAFSFGSTRSWYVSFLGGSFLRRRVSAFVGPIVRGLAVVYRRGVYKIVDEFFLAFHLVILKGLLSNLLVVFRHASRAFCVVGVGLFHEFEICFFGRFVGVFYALNFNGYFWFFPVDDVNVVFYRVGIMGWYLGVRSYSASGS